MLVLNNLFSVCSEALRACRRLCHNCRLCGLSSSVLWTTYTKARVSPPPPLPTCYLRLLLEFYKPDFFCFHYVYYFVLDFATKKFSKVSFPGCLYFVLANCLYFIQDGWGCQVGQDDIDWYKYGFNNKKRNKIKFNH